MIAPIDLLREKPFLKGCLLGMVRSGRSEGWPSLFAPPRVKHMATVTAIIDHMVTQIKKDEKEKAYGLSEIGIKHWFTPPLKPHASFFFSRHKKKKIKNSVLYLRLIVDVWIEWFRSLRKLIRSDSQWNRKRKNLFFIIEWRWFYHTLPHLINSLLFQSKGKTGLFYINSSI